MDVWKERMNSVRTSIINLGNNLQGKGTIPRCSNYLRGHLVCKILIINGNNFGKQLLLWNASSQKSHQPIGYIHMDIILCSRYPKLSVNPKMKLCRVTVFILFVNGQVLMIHLGCVVALTRHGVVLTGYVMTHPGTLSGMAYTTPKKPTNILPK